MNDEKDIKLCKDCKYYENFWLDKNLSKCYNTKSKKNYIDPITGKIHYPFCQHERQNSIFGTCGEEAKLFEPKKSIWKRYLEWRDE